MSSFGSLLDTLLDIPHLREAVSELKKIDSLLAQISRNNSRLSRSGLENLGSNALRAAGRYGGSAADYLEAYQAAASAGYRDAEGIAGLSLAAQKAGGLTAELADSLLSAAGQAYRMEGSVSGLTKVLDGMNRISGQNALDMAELAEGMAALGSTAAGLGLDAGEASAALGTLITASGLNGSEAAAALKAVLLCLGQVADAEEGITVKGLKRYEDACKALNVSLREVRDGALSLRDPMEVLGELSAAYNRLGEDDPRRSALLDPLKGLGGSAGADGLDALLSRWDTCEAMLQQYADSAGSLAADAEKNTDSWEGSLNRLSNTWTETVGSFADSGAIVSAVDSLNKLLNTVNKFAGIAGSLSTLSILAGSIAGAKNLGQHMKDSANCARLNIYPVPG